MELTLPPALERGDKVAIIRPGNGPAKTEFSGVYGLGMERLREEFDLEPVEFPTCDMGMQELSENPEKRAEDVMEAFRDPEIKGVISAIGGSGEQVKILKHLDPEVLRQNPTRFYGYSDNTSLGLYLWKHGIVNFQGPMVMTELAMQGEMHDYTRRYVEKAFFEDSLGKIEVSPEFTDETLEWGEPENLEKTREMEPHPGLEWYNSGQGRISGRTWGGCLDVVSINLQADKPLPEPEELEGEILVLEASEEMPDEHFVQRFMMSLGERGMLEKFSAVLVGLQKARHREERTGEEREEYRRNQRESIKNMIDEYAPGTPAVFNLNFGHADPVFPMPLGGRIEIDTDQKNIRIPLD
jgi:muramoyltetrapeptide carboxypeptidase LdcA involved in peptidoglycan recycling